MEAIEFTGKTTEDALQAAQEHFGLPLDQLEVEVISAGSSGFLGFFGGKKARIRVRPLGQSAQDQVAEVLRELQDPDATPPKSEATIADYSDQPEASPQPQEPETTPSPTSGRKPPEPPEVVESARQVLTRLLSVLDPDASVSAQTNGATIELEIQAQEVGILIGRRGQTLEALQYLTTRIVSHQQGRPVRITIDAGAYRKRRRQALEDMARRMAQKAKDSGKPVTLGPLPAPERRIIHLTLKDDKKVATASRGRGEMKRIVISPK